MSEQQPSGVFAPIATDWSRHLLGACSSGDPLRGPVVQNYTQVRQLRTELDQVRADLRALRERARWVAAGGEPSMDGPAAAKHILGESAP